MKKLLAFILAALMLLSLVACDIETLPNNKNDDSSQNQTNGNTLGNNQTDNPGNKNEITFSGLVAVDNSECTIKVTEIDPDNIWGYTLKVQLENKSTDKTYMFSVESAAIDGIQCDPFFATEVAAGKKSNKEISFTKSQLEESGIKDYTDIELTLHVYDTNDWMADDVAKETIHIYPYGESKAVKYVRTSKATDNIIVDNEHVTVIVTGYKEDAIWGYTVKLFLLNKTNKNVMFSVDEVSVNGYMADPFFAKSVSAEKCAFSSMSWSDTIFEENGITSIEEIEFNLRVYNVDDWFEDDLVNKTVSLTP